MAPETRWFLAAVLTIGAVVWLISRWIPPHGFTRAMSTLSVTRIDDHSPLASEGSVDLEGRWIGHGLIVKHHPHEQRTQFFAQLDADGNWADNASENQSPAP